MTLSPAWQGLKESTGPATPPGQLRNAIFQKICGIFLGKSKSRISTEVISIFSFSSLKNLI